MGGMNSLKFSKQTKGDDCWVFRGLLIVLMLKQTLKNQGKSFNEKIQGKSNKIPKNEREKYTKSIRNIYARKYILEKNTCLRKIQRNPKNIMETSQEKRGFESGCDTSVLYRMFGVSSQMGRRPRLA